MNYTDTQKAKLFDALFADGVDNWEGYQQENYQQAIEEIELEGKYDRVQDELQPLFEIIETHIEVDYPAGREAGSRTSLTTGGIDAIVEWITKKYEN
jgi:hypothetical protein